MIYHLLRPLLFACDPERAHEGLINLIEKTSQFPGFKKFIRWYYGWDSPHLEIRLWKRILPSPIGLAAGFDKNGRIIDALFSLGFGMVEVGTLTPRTQPGNPLPRVFRLVEDRAFINRLGFNNKGLESMMEMLCQRESTGMLGVNLGKNLDTPLVYASKDYVKSMEGIHPWVDYFCINISSPNTENLRFLQEGEKLKRLLDAVCIKRDILDAERSCFTPVLVKLAPDWGENILERSIIEIGKHPIDGLIATNTTLDRNNLKSSFRMEQGGLSGAPLFDLSNRILNLLYSELGHRMPIVGVGGIFNGKDAYEKIRAGASAVQIYTSLIYEGPAVVKRIKKELVRLLHRDGLASVIDAVGLDVDSSI